MGLFVYVSCRCGSRPCPHELSREPSFSATYEGYRQFQRVVAAVLENGHAGSRFPVLQKLKPGGLGQTVLRYSEKEASVLKAELAEIRLALWQLQLAGFNLGLLMRKLTGIGKPRVLQGLVAHLLRLIFVILSLRTVRKGLFARRPRNSASFSIAFPPFFGRAERPDPRLWNWV